MGNKMRNYLRKANEERDHFASRPTGLPPLMRFWVFRIQSPDVKSFLILKEETQQEAIDHLPTHDSFYSKDQLQKMNYKLSLGKDIVRQSWTGPDGKRMHLNFHLLDFFYSIGSARDYVRQIEKEKA